MSTPQLTFLAPNKNGDHWERKRHTSTYCGECICGQHFQIRWLEWICPDCLFVDIIQSVNQNQQLAFG
jgi:hypothetical protein